MYLITKYKIFNVTYNYYTALVHVYIAGCNYFCDNESLYARFLVIFISTHSYVSVYEKLTVIFIATYTYLTAKPSVFALFMY